MQRIVHRMVEVVDDVTVESGVVGFRGHVPGGVTGVLSTKKRQKIHEVNKTSPFFHNIVRGVSDFRTCGMPLKALATGKGQQSQSEMIV